MESRTGVVDGVTGDGGVGGGEVPGLLTWSRISSRGEMDIVTGRGKSSWSDGCLHRVLGDILGLWRGL